MSVDKAKSDASGLFAVISIQKPLFSVSVTTRFDWITSRTNVNGRPIGRFGWQIVQIQHPRPISPDNFSFNDENARYLLEKCQGYFQIKFKINSET